MNTSAAAINRKIDAINRKANPAGRPAKDVSEMSAAAINREMESLSRKMSALNDEMIEVGRGHERPSDTEGKTDPLSVRFNAARSRWADLRYEVKRRAGPDVDRLPRGFGPMKNPAGRGKVSPAGIPIHRTKQRANFPFAVEVKNTENWNTAGNRSPLTLDEAEAQALALIKKYPRLPVRITIHEGGPMKNPTPKRAPRTVALLARKSNPAGGVLFAIKVNAGNDRSGDPRRGWVVEEIIDGADIRHIGFVDEEYGGARSLREAYGDLPTTGEFDISPKDYAHFKKMGPVWIETGRYLGRR